ncbi:hypothetical protein Q5752_004398 [Cryptotrichosporon argae]
MAADRAAPVLIVAAVFLALATVFTALRCVSKWAIRRRATADDAVAVLAWALNTGLMVAIIVATKYGLGKMDADFKPEWEAPLRRSIYAFTTLYNPCLMATKTAILILYIRMAAAHPFLRYASIATMAVVNIAGIVCTFISIFECRPIGAAFTARSGQCIDIIALYLSTAPIIILTDFAILLLPLPILTGLRMELRSKIGLVLTFICGGFVTVVDVIRIAYLQASLKAELRLADPMAVSIASRPPNFLYDVSFAIMWSGVESSVGLMCCCALVLKPLIQHLWPGRHGTTRYSRDTASDEAALGVGEVLSKGAGSGGGGGASSGSGNGHRGSDASATANGQGYTGGHGLQGVMSHVKRVSVFGGREPAPPVPRSPNLPLQAILETSPDVPDEDCVNIYDFFAAGPADSGGGSGGDAGLASPPPAKTAPRISTSSARTFARRVSTLSRRPSGYTEPAPPSPATTAKTLAESQQPTQRFFDFVQMGGHKQLTELTNRESWLPVIFVTILFFLWGFSYGLLGSLNVQIEAILSDPSPSRALALQNSYWIGYFVSPLTIGLYVLPRHGFKATFLTGLSLYACGALAFWPSAVLASYPGFFISNLLVASGLSLLEASANPFIALAGPDALAEARLNFAQAMQGIGSFTSPIVASHALFTDVDGRQSLFRVQWCYLAVACFVVLLALVFFYVPLGEVDDAELERLAAARAAAAGFDPARPPTLHIPGTTRCFFLRPLALGTAVAAMALYVGAQEALDYFWAPLVAALAPSVSAFWSHTYARIAFSAGRYAACALCALRVPPRWVVLVSASLAAALALVLAVVPHQTGPAAHAPLVLCLFFQGPVFPTLYALALRGMGRWTKRASIALTAAISFGAAWQSVAYGAIIADGADPRAAAAVAAAGFAAAAVVLLWLAAPAGGRWADPWLLSRTHAPLGDADEWGTLPAAAREAPSPSYGQQSHAPPWVPPPPLLPPIAYMEDPKQRAPAPYAPSEAPYAQADLRPARSRDGALVALGYRLDDVDEADERGAGADGAGDEAGGMDGVGETREAGRVEVSKADTTGSAEAGKALDAQPPGPPPFSPRQRCRTGSVTFAEPEAGPVVGAG